MGSIWSGLSLFWLVFFALWLLILLNILLWIALQMSLSISSMKFRGKVSTSPRSLCGCEHACSLNTSLSLASYITKTITLDVFSLPNPPKEEELSAMRRHALIFLSLLLTSLDSSNLKHMHTYVDIIYLCQIGVICDCLTLIFRMHMLSCHFSLALIFYNSAFIYWKS